MIGLDTNVLARYFVEEQGVDAATARQRQAARALLESGQRLFLPKTVALELEWVLRGYYGFGPSQVLQVFDHLLAHPALELEDRSVLEQALAGLRAGLDFADALHHASCRACEAMATFDARSFARRLRPLNLAPGSSFPPLPDAVMPATDPLQLPDLPLRQELVAVARRMNASGINQGTSGNLSLRIPGGLLITPSSLPYEQMEPADLVALDLQGRPLLAAAPAGETLAAPVARRPSTEWRLHADILASRPEITAVLHCHSVHATALACHGRAIPPFHYMTAVAGGDDIRCAPYATFGTAELSQLAVEALRDRLACLLAQHGQVAVGTSLDQALRIAIEVETLARMYLQALQLGEPPLLSPEQMAAVHHQFRTLLYGAADPAAAVPAAG